MSAGDLGAGSSGPHHEQNRSSFPDIIPMQSQQPLESLQEFNLVGHIEKEVGSLETLNTAEGGFDHLHINVLAPNTQSMVDKEGLFLQDSPSAETYVYNGSLKIMPCSGRNKFPDQDAAVLRKRIYHKQKLRRRCLMESALKTRIACLEELRLSTPRDGNL